MKLKFYIDFRTSWGQELFLNILDGDKIGLKPVGGYNGGRNISECVMRTVDGSRWECEVDCDCRQGGMLEYFYCVKRSGYVERSEWCQVFHRLDFTAVKGGRYIMFDHWCDTPGDSYLYSSAFTDCVKNDVLDVPVTHNYERTVQLRVRVPQLRKDEKLMLVGDGEALGSWKIENALDMTLHNINEWVVDIDTTRLEKDTLEFKFCAYKGSKTTGHVWEANDNRTVTLPEIKDGDVIVYELPQAFFDYPDMKCAGTLVPVFSLRSETSFGVGDFGDLKKMIDWVSQTRQRVLQILPINDTTTTHTWTDSYPYSCISIFALHPQYADLTALPEIKDDKTRAEMETLRKELNTLSQIDYERVNDAKIRYLRVIFEQEGQKMMATDDFKKFFKECEEWLVPYARFCSLRDANGTADFSKWEGHTTWDEGERKALSSARTKLYKEVAFYYFVQYVLSTQMSKAHDYALERGVILKGDIPIGVSRYGCDVWSEPRYFNLNGQAGAPPDDFSVNGQNWGFPTYNWQEMLKDGCSWWIRRFSNMSKYFDAYRIDHVLGFFRIWEIPVDAVYGLLGQFSPSLGMTREEIEAYGLNFNLDRYTRPFITDWTLDRLFAERVQEVKDKYLDRLDDERYQMKPEYDTQRKVEKAFETVTEEKDLWLRDGIYALISDVLFLRDHSNPELFHPRISVQHDFIYESLGDSDKAIFNRLYNDYFYRRNNNFWYSEAMKKMPMLVNATRMLVCAEDLGMVPDCVPWVMNELSILSLELQSMPKDSSTKFGHLSRNPYRSVCTISSHDMPTLRLWWDEDRDRTQEYYNTMLHRSGAAPSPLPGWLARDIISRHLTSPSMLCILSIQDWMAIDEKLRLADAAAERINIPANPKHYWRYRMHVSIEELMANETFNGEIKKLVKESGRR